MDYEFPPDMSSYEIDQHQELLPAAARIAIASGYLHKLAHGNSLMKVWHERFYVLYSDGLMYSYLNARSKASHRTIPVGRLCLRMKFGQETVQGECESWPRSVPIQCRFTLVNTDRVYHFHAENENDLLLWKHHLQSTMERLCSQIVLSSKTQLATGQTEDTHVSAINDKISYKEASINPYDSSKASSEESMVEYVHRTNLAVAKLVETTFGEITASI